MTEYRQEITVIMIFRRPNKKSLERWAGVFWSSREKNTPSIFCICCFRVGS